MDGADPAGGAGGVNTGSGGGGGGYGGYPPSGGTGGNGGSGVVILRIPKEEYTGTVSGSPTVTAVGSYNVLTFTGSGSYTG